MRNEPGARPTPVEQRQSVRQDKPAGCLLRLFWMAFGNLALFLVAILIVKQGAFSALDAAYWAVVVAIGAARYGDIAHFAGLTTSGDPATMAHFRRHVLSLVGGAAVLWAGAHVLRRFL